MIAIVDVCGGNLRSVQRAIEHVGAEVVVTQDPAVVERADKLVVPGQGAFAMFMQGLKDRGLGDVLRAKIDAGTPYLGICLGLQVLFEHSEEGDVDGLGVLKGQVVRFRPVDPTLKVPHMGWNRVAAKQPVAGISDGDHVYFVHSFHVVPEDRSVIALEATHGITFTAAVARDNLFACQFHPEKSQQVGLSVLKAFTA
ncbi:MAG: imidazole glycerol phosphate synthase subunit HisH [Kofleriaceae bacterium]